MVYQETSFQPQPQLPDQTTLKKLILVATIAAGVQFGWALQLSLLTPYTQLLGLSHKWVSFVWLCGPISGLIVQPIVGHHSDRCTSRFGRRRPFIVAGTALLSVGVLLIGFAADIGRSLGDSLKPGLKFRAATIFILGFWLLDISNNMIQSPCRALLADISGDNDAMVTLGNALFAFFMAVGNVLGYASGALDLHRFFPFTKTEACNQNCANIKTCFMLSVLFTTLTITLVVYCIDEERPDRDYLQYLRHGYENDDADESWTPPPSFLVQIVVAARSTSRAMWMLYVVTALNWVGFFPFLLYDTDWMGKEVYGGKIGGSEEELNMYNQGVRMGSLGLMSYVLTMGVVSLFLEGLVRFFGGVKRLWSFTNFVLAMCMGFTVMITYMAVSARERTSVLVPPPLGVKVSCFALFAILGIPQAITFCIPFALASIYSKDTGTGQGLALGLLNLAIVIPQDLFTGFRGGSVFLTYNPSSEIYHGVVSKCRTLHGRYLVTPWLSSPHIQTSFVNFFGRPPVFTYRRQMFHASDGGMFALDWLMHSDVSGADIPNNTIAKDDATPIVVMIPGLTSDSASPYLKHLVFNTAKHGWNVVVSNHRGLGGVSVTSDCFYNAGWTEDVREVINHLHQEYSAAPLFVVGTSIGANILVKYLGEDGENVPIAGAAAVCSPWDLLIGSRFISRRLIQKLYDRALTIGLQGYAQLHETRYSRLANWDGIKKSRSIRDFDTHATCLVGNYETVDTYYRRCSSSSFIGKVKVPLLCISALDDPVCTREAIPWDECRANKNVVLVTTQHGGHLAFFEGIGGSGLWWVRAVNEYLGALLSSSLMHTQKKAESVDTNSAHVQSSIDQGPYLNVADGMVAPMGNERNDGAINEVSEQNKDHHQTHQIVSVKENHVFSSGRKPDFSPDAENNAGLRGSSMVEKCMYQLSRQTNKSMWLLAYIAVISSWPIVGAALGFLFKRKSKRPSK